jgi:hypothetical protein
MRMCLGWTVVSLLAVTPAGHTQEAKSAHIILSEPQFTWGDGPPSLPKGGMMAVLSGDPTKPTPYTVRAKLPAGYTIPPHWHPTDENITVLAGTVAFGMGEKIVTAEMKDVPVGGYAQMPATMRHYFMAKTAAVIQVHGMGPLVVNYVNPADDPRERLSSPR